MIRVLWYPKRWKEILTDREVMFITSNRMRAYNFHEAIRALPGIQSEIAGYTLRHPAPSEFDVVVYQKVFNRKQAFLLRQSGVITILDACDALRLPGGLPLALNAIVTSSHELASFFQAANPRIPVEVIEDGHEANPDRIKIHQAAPKLRVTTYGTPDTVEWSIKAIQPVLSRLDWIDFSCAAGATATSAYWKGSTFNRPEIQFHMDWREAWKRMDSWQEFIFQSDVGVVPPAEPRARSHHKILNYMAYGIPVVCQPSDANRRLIRHGVNGFLAESAEEWSEALKILRDPDVRTRIGAEARKTAAEPFRVEAMGAKYASLMQRLAGGAPERGVLKQAIQTISRAALKAIA